MGKGGWGRSPIRCLDGVYSWVPHLNRGARAPLPLDTASPHRRPPPRSQRPLPRTPPHHTTQPTPFNPHTINHHHTAKPRPSPRCISRLTFFDTPAPPALFPCTGRFAFSAPPQVQAGTPSPPFLPQHIPAQLSPPLCTCRFASYYLPLRYRPPHPLLRYMPPNPPSPPGTSRLTAHPSGTSRLTPSSGTGRLTSPPPSPLMHRPVHLFGHARHCPTGLAPVATHHPAGFYGQDFHGGHHLPHRPLGARGDQPGAD